MREDARRMHAGDRTGNRSGPKCTQSACSVTPRLSAVSVNYATQTYKAIHRRKPVASTSRNLKVVRRFLALSTQTYKTVYRRAIDEYLRITACGFSSFLA